VCGGLLTGPNGVIDIQNETRARHWPSMHSYLNCDWNITVQVGRTIAIEFPVFSIPSLDTAHCTENYIIVSDNSRATELLHLCILFIFREKTVIL
jgi:DNA-binding helix-hairpin-helix protein with protein kinase domain